MSANYKELTATGTIYQRARCATIVNPHITKGIPPQVFFQEEEVLDLGNGNMHFRDITTSCNKVFEPSTTFPLLNPSTGEPTGATATHSELYVLLYSLYMQTALERDALV